MTDYTSHQLEEMALNLSTNQLIDVISIRASNSKSSMREIATITSVGKRQVVRDLKASGHEFSPKINFEQACIAYKKVLTEDITPEEALIYLEEITTLTSEFIKQAKNNTFMETPNRLKTAKRIVERHKEEPVQKSMIKRGTMDKNHIENSNTINQQLKRVHRSRKLDKAITDLEVKVEVLEHSDLDKSLRVSSLETSVDTLKVALPQIKFLTQEQEAIKLRADGHAVSDIAKHLGKNVRTIYRWTSKTKGVLNDSYE